MLFTFIAGVLLGFGAMHLYDSLESYFDFSTYYGLMLGMSVYPFILTFIQAYLLFFGNSVYDVKRKEKAYDFITLVLGIFYTGMHMELNLHVVINLDWMQQGIIYNQVHTPIYTQSAPTLTVICLIWLAGYLLLNYRPADKTPPLLTVLAMSGLYLGTGLGIVWSVQVFKPDLEHILLILLPVNCVLITARTVKNKVKEWEVSTDKPVLGRIGRLLNRAKLWPAAAFVLMWPLLGVIIVILALFGQEPDSVIKAWLETSQWNLSQRVSPPNLSYDEHYLCTVAAQGHPKIVRPLRSGVRHGHRVTVNRQLCIANAFEQILEEKAPGFHRAVRAFYDKYGFPVAKLIRTKLAADAVYIIMKPLELIFLAVIYAADTKPENRISMQYTDKRALSPAIHVQKGVHSGIVLRDEVI